MRKRAMLAKWSKIDSLCLKSEGKLWHEAMTFFLIFLGLSASLLFVGSLLVTSSGYELIMGDIALVCLALVEGVRLGDRTIGFIFFISAVSIALVLPRIDSPITRLLVFALYLGGLEILQLGSCLRCSSNGGMHEPRSRASLLPLILSLAGLSAFIWISSRDEVWFLLQRIVDLINLSGGSVGFSASGGKIYLLAGLAMLFSCLLKPCLKKFTALVILLTSFVLAKHLLLLAAPITASKLSLFNIACLAWCSFLVAKFTTIFEVKPHLQRAILAGLGVLVILLGVASWLNQRSFYVESPASAVAKEFATQGLSDSSSVSGSKSDDAVALRYRLHPDIVVYKAGLLDWELPSFERVGQVNSGMFGLFRRGLERLAESRDGRVVMTDSLTDDCLSNAWLGVFINPTRMPTQHELSLLHQFIKHGGSMLVLGDHTDIGGSRSCLNSLLSISAIQFNFDSAIGLRKYWRGCLEIRPHPVTRGIPNETFVQIAVGASLNVASPGHPIIVGRYGFSDIGDYKNGGLRAFMGNTTHEHHEKLGDLVLVACQKIGDGRVLVFGDTSPFQNGALFLSWRLVGNSLAWLAGVEPMKPGRRSEILVHPDPDRYLSHFIWTGFADEKAIIDFSLMPKASLQPYQSNSVGGLANSLARVGVEARAVVSSDDWIGDAKYLFIISPTRKIGETQASLLKAFMEKGGHIILALDYLGCQRFGICEEMGFRIDPIPLGSGEENDLISHKEAWPIVYDTSKAAATDTLVLATAFGHPTGVMKPYGKGGLTLISDARLLFDENLESERTGKPVNIAFVSRLIEAMRTNGRGD